MLISTVSLQPPHSVTQQLLMACIQQQPVSAALYIALIKVQPLVLYGGLKESEKERGERHCHLKHQYNNPLPRRRGLGLPTSHSTPLGSASGEGET